MSEITTQDLANCMIYLLMLTHIIIEGDYTEYINEKPSETKLDKKESLETLKKIEKPPKVSITYFTNI